MTMITKKLVIIGDGYTGKTALLVVFKEGTFPQNYLATILETYVHPVEVDGLTVDLTIWDTAGQEDYDRLRPLSYPDTDVFLFCFSVDNRDSFRNIKERWLPEITHYRPYAARTLVGTKVDLRDDEPTIQKLQNRGQEMVLTEEGNTVARQLNASGYFECSAKTGEGVREVFVAAVKAALTCKQPRKLPCHLL